MHNLNNSPTSLQITSAIIDIASKWAVAVSWQSAIPGLRGNMGDFSKKSISDKEGAWREFAVHAHKDM